MQTLHLDTPWTKLDQPNTVPQTDPKRYPKCSPTCHKTQSYLSTKVHPQKIRPNPGLVIKPFNKGSGICLMDTSLHISKFEEHLANPSTYKELSSDSTQAIRDDVLSILNYLYNTYRIDDVTRHHLTPPKPAWTPLFYGLFKVHKHKIPLWPIVSECDSPSNQLSNYVTHFIQPLVEILPTYIRGSRHFLQLLESFQLCLRTLF